MSWLYVPGIAESNWELNSSCLKRELSVTLSGTPTLRPISWPGWRTRPWMRLLSGITSRPSVAGAGVGRWISSLRATRASRSRLQAKGAEQKTRGISGPILLELSLRFGRQSASSRTLLAISPWGFHQSRRTYSAWATGLRQESSRRLSAARRTRGKGYLFWGTPMARVGWSCGEPFARHDLNCQAKLWPTPLASDAKGAHVNRKWQPGGFRPQLREQAIFFQSFLRGRRNLRSGMKFFGRGQTLNPLFVEWMMGIPEGWTDCDLQVTGWSQWLQRSRSYVCWLLLREEIGADR
jgi:hypothetical protein